MFLPFYSLFGLVSIIIFAMFYINTLRIKQNEDKSIISFRVLIIWVSLFSALDLMWGLCSGGAVKSSKFFFVVSTFFHIGTVITAISWISYIISVFGESIVKKKKFRFIFAFLLLIQITLVIVNIFNPIIFYITDDCKYVPCFLRPVAFSNQYFLYALAAIISMINIIRAEKGQQIKHVIVFSYIFAPMIFGVLQLLYPDAPYYTIGYLIGCTIIYSFVVSDQEILFLKKYIREQKNQYKDYFDKSQREISRNVEILYSMADIYYSMHLIDLENDTVIPYSARDEVKEIVNSPINATHQMEEVISATVIEGFLDSAIQFTDLRTLPERMRNRKILEAQFVGKNLGWFIASFIAIESDSEGKPRKVIFTTRNIDEEKRKEQNLIYKSNTDELTGFYNRRAYDMDAKNLEKTGVPENFVYVSIDINGLKVVNDSIGHAAGDELITGACSCMKEVFDNYGKLYRTGGDEFVAVIYVSETELEVLKNKLETLVSAWKGKLIEKVSLSCGYVVAREASDLSLHDISVLADKRMYEEKSRHYRQAGFDRRGQRDAHVALCALYTKILKINISDDTYQIINMDANEQNENFGFAPKISEWLYNFGKSGLVHPEDLEEYFEKTNLAYISEYFTNNKKSLLFMYRRKYGDIYKKVVMEIIPTNDYSKTEQTFFLYVKNIEL